MNAWTALFAVAVKLLTKLFWIYEVLTHIISLKFAFKKAEKATASKLKSDDNLHLTKPWLYLAWGK